METKLNGYIGFYKGQRFETHADTSYHAQLQMAKEHRVKRPSDITVVLAEKDDKPVTHVADF